ncbi:12392_t:CDS:2, partial [Cetraspora pellucida]
MALEFEEPKPVDHEDHYQSGTSVGKNKTNGIRVEKDNHEALEEYWKSAENSNMDGQNGFELYHEEETEDLL